MNNEAFIPMKVNVNYCINCGQLFYSISRRSRKCNKCLSEIGRRFTKNLTSKQEREYLKKKLKRYKKRK